jgi:hypothetical protein
MVMFMSSFLFDFVDNKGESVIAAWLVQERITKRDRGQLNLKLDMLALAGAALPPKLLAGPINKQRHIYKLVIHGDMMLRPMLCKGPFDMDSEFTLLLGALEIQSKLIPSPEKASENREILLTDKKRRVPHVRY